MLGEECSAITANGATIYGAMGDSARWNLSTVAFMWDAQHGTRAVADVFRSDPLIDVMACSSDGSVIFAAAEGVPGAERLTRVAVTNRKPTANAGRDVTIVTTSERGARAVLDGTFSSDPDKDKLSFRWTATGVKLVGPTSRRPAGRFPIGAKTVRLTVKDPGGLTASDTVRVTVRLKNAQHRPSGAIADAFFARATRNAVDAAATEPEAVESLAGLAYANVASGLGDAAGEFVHWNEGESPSEALSIYGELRLAQHRYGAAAARSLFSAYVHSGYEKLLTAHNCAAYGTAYSAVDLSQR